MCKQERWPTPTQGMYKQDVNDRGEYAQSIKDSGHQITLPAAVKLDAQGRVKYPTPRASAIDESWETIMARRKRTGIGHMNLSAYVKHNYPTPRASDGLRDGMSMETHLKTSQREDGGFQTLHTKIAKQEGTTEGTLNPDWVEWLMGWPIGWTALEEIKDCIIITWDVDPADLDVIPRIKTKTPKGKSRLKAIGNGQSPQALVLAIRCLVGLKDE